jgi:hypothetical protein
MRQPQDISDFEIADIIDGRDVQGRFDELEAERAILAAAIEDTSELGEAAEALANAEKALADWESKYSPELNALKSFLDEIGSDALHGVPLINEHYFEDYARDYAEGLLDRHDIGRHDTSWPFSCIDWEKAARVLRRDYTGADLNGTTFYFN